MEKKTQLEIGDKLTSFQYGSIQGFTTVTRVTAKRAFCLSSNGGYEDQFDRTLGSRGDATLIGRDRFGPSYSLTTQADLDKAELRLARNEVGQRAVKRAPFLTIEQCNAIMAILNSTT